MSANEADSSSREKLELTEGPRRSLLLGSNQTAAANPSESVGSKVPEKNRKKPDFAYLRRFAQQQAGASTKSGGADVAPKDDIFARLTQFLAEKPDPLAPLQSAWKNQKTDAVAEESASAVEIVAAQGESCLEQHATMLGGGKAAQSVEKLRLPDAGAGGASSSTEADETSETKRKSALIEEVTTDDSEKMTVGECENVEQKPSTHMVFSDDEEDEEESGKDAEADLQKRMALFQALLGGLDANDPRVEVATDSDDDSDDDEEAETETNANKEKAEEDAPRAVEMEVGLGIFDVNGQLPKNLQPGVAGAEHGIVEVRDPVIPDTNATNNNPSQGTTVKDGILLP